MSHSKKTASKKSSKKTTANPLQDLANELVNDKLPKSAGPKRAKNAPAMSKRAIAEREANAKKLTTAAVDEREKQVANDGLGAPAPAAATDDGPFPETTPAPVAEQPARDPRLPPPGTIIVKRDRAGAERSRCTVTTDGIDYLGTLYKSLSGAAMAAAKDLGIGGKTQNGFAFWGITKPTRKGADPLATLNKAAERFVLAAAAALANHETRDAAVRTLTSTSELMANASDKALKA